MKALKRVKSRLMAGRIGATPFLKSLREFVFDDTVVSWDQANSLSSGYFSENILEKVKESTLRVLRGEAAYERDSVTFAEYSFNWPLLAGLMWAAARTRGPLSVLDIGGSLGSTYLQHRRFLDALPGLAWNIVEQPAFVREGKSLNGTNMLNFFDSLADSSAASCPDVVHFGSSLQYFKDPYDCLAQVAMTNAKFLILDRIPVTAKSEDVLAVQYVHASIYAASYPAWLFSEELLCETLSRRWSIVSSFDSLGGSAWTRLGTRVMWKGWILERRHNHDHAAGAL